MAQQRLLEPTQPKKQFKYIDLGTLSDKEVRQLAKTIKQMEANKAEYQRIQAFRESGQEEKLYRLLSMVYITHSIANAYAEEAVDMVDGVGLLQRKLKEQMMNLETAFDLFDKTFYALCRSDEVQKAFCEDYDILKEALDKFMDNKNITEKLLINNDKE